MKCKIFWRPVAKGVCTVAECGYRKCWHTQVPFNRESSGTGSSGNTVAQDFSHQNTRQDYGSHTEVSGALSAFELPMVFVCAETHSSLMQYHHALNACHPIWYQVGRRVAFIAINIYGIPHVLPLEPVLKHLDWVKVISTWQSSVPNVQENTPKHF